MARAFPATYHGNCVECGSRISPGDLIVPDDEDAHGGWKHLQCDDTPDTYDLPQVCGVCFLTVCDCGKDLR